jgi:nucleoside 2-deoxyribosyltransferase
MRILKVYLAAPFSRKDAINVYAAELRACGIEVTSRWLDENHLSSVQMTDLSPIEHQTYAVQDLDDVAKADILVLFTDPTKTIIRAGRHVEFGIAVGINLTLRPMPIFVVGNEHENIFHYLSQVRHYDSWDTAKLVLKNISNSGRLISENY